MNRKELLNRLLMVSPGLSKAETIQQSSCVVLRKGRFYTMSQEIACSVASGLPSEFEGAVPADSLIKILQVVPDEELKVSLEEGIFFLKGKGRRTKLACHAEVILPVDSVELPKSSEWQDITHDFVEGVEACHPCTSERGEFLHQCLHITPEWVEAGNNQRVAHCKVATFVKEPVLVKGRTVRQLCQLGMTFAAETDSWLHFKNPTGLRVSVRKYAREFYPDFSPFLKSRGQQVKFSKTLGLSIKAASVCSSDDLVRVVISDGKVSIIGVHHGGEHVEFAKLPTRGVDADFQVCYEHLMDLIDKYGKCEIVGNFLRAGDDKVTYLMSVSKGQP